MDLGLDGKVVLVAGASRGIGRGIVQSLLEEGARVAMAARGAEALDAAHAELDATYGAIYSQRALLDLVEAGMDRQAAYKIVQRDARRAWDSGLHLRELLMEDPEVRARLTPEQIEGIFDPRYHTEHIGAAFERLGLTAPATARR